LVQNTSFSISLRIEVLRLRWYEKREKIKFKDFMSRKSVIYTNNKQLNFGLLGINVTSESFFNSSCNDPYFMVFGVFGIVLSSTIIEHLLRSHGLDRWADGLDTMTKLAIPLSFYIFLCLGVISIF
jgi:hypothetical protein